MSEDLVMVTRAVLLITYVWHVIQYMKNIILVVVVLLFMELSTKHIHMAYIPAVCTTTMSHVLCVMWLHVLHKWWYQVVTCVPRDGHANTKDTWCRNIMITIVQCSLAWMKTLTTYEEPMLILTALYSISLKEYVAHFPANLISQDMSWHAQYAPVKIQLLSMIDFNTYWHHLIQILTDSNLQHLVYGRYTLFPHFTQHWYSYHCNYSVMKCNHLCDKYKLSQLHNLWSIKSTNNP